MEGEVYLCRWSHRSGEYTITLKRDAKVKAKGSTLDQAEQRIYDQLADRYGDCEPVVEYDRPLPKTAFEEKYGNPAIVRVSGNDNLGPANAGELLVHPPCPTCQRQRLDRTAEQIRYEHRLRGSDGATAWGKAQDVFSEEFLALLNDAEQTAKRFSREVLQRLRGHAWPGNVRALKNLVHHAFIFADDEIGEDCLPPEFSDVASDASALLHMKVGISKRGWTMLATSRLTWLCGAIALDVLSGKGDS
jgi:hypothetical protein